MADGGGYSIDVDELSQKSKEILVANLGVPVSQLRAKLASLATPVAGTSPQGNVIASIVNSTPASVEPQLAAIEQRGRGTDDATQQGTRTVEERDKDGAEVVSGKNDPQQQMQQMQQVASQSGSSLLQLPTQLLQTATQTAQQAGQIVGQMAHQGAQQLSQLNKQDTFQPKDTKELTDPSKTGGGGAGAGKGGGAGAGGGGGGSVPTVGGALPGAASATQMAASPAGGRTTANTAPAMPMGGMPMVPPHRGAQGEGGSGVTPGAEAAEVAPLVDGTALPFVDQQIGALPVIETGEEPARPPFETTALGDK